jgi:hypothetical protein
LPTPRGLSQAPTSFIGSWCLDIHRLPLVACHTTKNYKDARVHYAVLKIRAGPPTPSTTTYPEQPAPPGKTTQQPRTTHQQYGESRPQPHHHTNPQHPPQGRPGQPVRHVTQKNRTILSPGHGPIPQDPTARLGPAPNITHVPHPNPTKQWASGSTSSIRQAPNLMVNVPRSEAPPPQDTRSGNDE